MEYGSGNAQGSSGKKGPNVSWRCVHCWQTAPKNAQFCAFCGGAWPAAADPTYQAPSTPSQGSGAWHQWDGNVWGQNPTDTWYTADWNQGDWQRPKSPRRRPSRSRPKGAPAAPNEPSSGKKGKGGGKGAGKKGIGPKGPHQSDGAPALPAGKGPPATMPKWNQSIPQPAKFVMPEVPAPPAASPAEAKLKELTAALRKSPDSLTPEVQALVKDVSLTTGQDETSEAVQAMEGFGRAKAQLNAIKWARYQNHGAWKEFLREAMEQMTTFAQAFQEQETLLVEAIQTAKAAVVAAKERSAAAQNEIKEISDGDEMDSADQPQVLQEGLANMTTAIKKLHQEAVTLHADENAPKRPRLEPNSSGLAAGGKGSRALEPFAKAGS